MTKIINLTQHDPTPEQIAAGVENYRHYEVKKLLTFDKLPKYLEVKDRANKLAEIAREGHYKYAMIGGEPFLMAPLERCLECWLIGPLYAFSKRVTEEHANADGSVTKTQVFKYEGFYNPFKDVSTNAKLEVHHV